MQAISVPWQKWLDEGEKEISFPDEWNLHVADSILEIPDAGDSHVRDAFRSPIGTPTIAEIAWARRNAVIAIDDITRPTPTGRLLPLVLEELALGGIGRKNVRVVVASGAHRESTRQEMVCKVGREILNMVDVIHHVPYENLVDLGKSSSGTPILTDRVFYEGDLKIAIGSIMPHPNAGFGGGRKLVSVGLSGVSTLREFHARDAGWLRTAIIHGNIQHQDLDDIMSIVGLDVAVEAVLTGRGGIANLYVGEPTRCFQLGVDRAWQLYSTVMPEGADIVVLNAYPKDYDLIQACNTLWVTLFPNMDIVRPGGTVVCMAACPDGVGLHFLSSQGMSDPTWFEVSSFKGRHLIWYSENLNEYDVHKHFPESVSVLQGWEDVLSALKRRHHGEVNVTIYPCAPLCLNPANRNQGAVPI